MDRPRLLRALVLLGFAFCASAFAQSYSWSHFSGMPPQPGGADGAGADARFYRPIGLVGSTTGHVFVADSMNHAIRRIGPDGEVVTMAGLPGRSGSANGMGAGARFSFPTGVALAGGALFVTDRGNDVIRRVTGAGAVSTFAGGVGLTGHADGPAASARFNDPAGIDADAGGNLFVADRLNHVIRRITPDGTVSTIAGLAGTPGAADGMGTAARFNRPFAVSADGRGNIFVADTGNHTVRRIAADGTVTTVAGAAGTPGGVNGAGASARFRFPSGILAFMDGSLIVADSSNDCLRLVSPTGVVSVFSGRLAVPGTVDGDRTTARYFEPTGLGSLVDGFAVADTFNHSIRKVTNEGVTTLAGPGGNFGRVDGTALTARFNYPNGIAVHESGDVYLADSRGNSIRSIATDGSTTKVAGQPTGDAYTDGPAGVAGLNYPHGLALAPDRTIYFCEQQRHTIRVVRPDGFVTTLAGAEGLAGSADGTGSAARFNFPSAIARDREGNLYVADTSNHTIRRIAAGGAAVTTFAGTPGGAGSADGTGTAARFTTPRGLVIDAEGNLLVADTGNHTIRQITPAGVVTTIAGRAGSSGSTDGEAGVARFANPAGLAVDSKGRIYIADMGNHTVRQIADGVVSTIGGRSGIIDYAEGTGSNANFFLPNDVAVDADGAVYVVQHGNNLVMKGVLDSKPAIVLAPQSIAVPAGSSATLAVTATGGGLSYQWRFNGAPIAGATGPTHLVGSVVPSTAGTYSVEIRNSAGTTTTAPVAVTVATSGARTTGRLVNLSILTALSEPGETFTLGYVVGGAGTSGAKPLLLRAAGPALALLGVSGAHPDPKLEIFAGAAAIGGNDNWGGTAALTSAFTSVGAFAYSGSSARDAAILAHLPPGDNSVKISGVRGGTGAVLAEIYDATPAASVVASTPRLVNVSVLKQVGSGLTMGFVVGGATPVRVLVRAIGPTIAAAPFGVAGAIGDPQLTLFANGTAMAANDNWGGTAELAAAFGAVGAFALANGSRDAAVVATLPPGGYTVTVSGVGGTSGVALIEVYEVP